MPSEQPQDEKDYVKFGDGYEDRLKRLKSIAEELLPHYGAHWHKHTSNVMRVEAMARLLYLQSLYLKIIDVPGVICEFGVRFGATTTTLSNLRAIYEPFNYSRTLYGFDTFEGLLGTNKLDGELAKDGDFSVPIGFEETLCEILDLMEKDSPVSHVKKFELIKGDATKTIDKWLLDNPHAIISMAIFDMDIYQPSREVLTKILPRLVKGSVIAFDEINYADFPGETLALNDVLGLNNLRLYRTSIQTHCAWMIWGE